MYTGLWCTWFCTLYNGIFLEIGSLSPSPMNSVCTNMSWNVVIVQSFWPWLSLASGRTSPTLMPQSTVASFPVCRNQTTKPPNPKNFLAEWRFKYLQKVKLVRLVGIRKTHPSIVASSFLHFLDIKSQVCWKWPTGVSSPPIGSNLSVSFSHIFVLCPKWFQPHARGHRSFWSLFVNHFLHDLKTANAKGLARWYEWCRSSRTCTLG